MIGERNEGRLLRAVGYAAAIAGGLAPFIVLATVGIGRSLEVGCVPTPVGGIDGQTCSDGVAFAVPAVGVVAVVFLVALPVTYVVLSGFDRCIRE